MAEPKTSHSDNQTDQFHPVTKSKNRRGQDIRREIELLPHEREDLAPWSIPRYIFLYWELSDFNEEHALRGVVLIGYPKSGYNLPTISLCKHQELITPQQTLKEYNSLLALSLLDIPQTAKLLYTYVDPDTDRSNSGAYLETFYSIVVADYSNSLRTEFLRETVFTAIQTLNIVEQLLMAVQAAHSKGIFHGAISPSNVLVTRTGNTFKIKLVNFGQHAENVDANDMTEPFYRCPEYIAKFTDMSYPSDMWGIMTLTVHLLTGLVIFRQSNDLLVLEEMVKYCGINKTDGVAFPKDRFMNGLTKEARTQLTVGQLTDTLMPKINENLGSNQSQEEIKAVDTLINFLVSCTYLKPEERITSTSALNKYFGKEIEETPLLRHNLFNERDYYNFDGDMGEEDEEIEKWAQRMYRVIRYSAYEQLDVKEFDANKESDKSNDNRGGPYDPGK